MLACDLLLAMVEIAESTLPSMRCSVFPARWAP